jgi:hypothetical protein
LLWVNGEWLGWTLVVGVLFREEEWADFSWFYGGKVGVGLGLMEKGWAVVFSRNLRPWMVSRDSGGNGFYFLPCLCWCLKWRGKARILGIDWRNQFGAIGFERSEWVWLLNNLL